MTIEGSIEAIGVSGRHWIGEGELDAFDLFRETLKSAKSSIRIAVFSLGWKSKELDSIFEILKNKIVTGVEVQLIINKFWSTADYGKKKLKELEHSNFTMLNYDPENENENLHAKIIVVDSKTILVGSANISKSGLFSNHELVIKISGGDFASRINNLLDILAREIYKKGSR